MDGSTPSSDATPLEEAEPQPAPRTSTPAPLAREEAAAFPISALADRLETGAREEVRPAALPPQNFRITDDSLGVGGPKTKFAANIAAIVTLKRIEDEKGQTGNFRAATPEEQDTLSRYVGWGSLPDAFDPEKEKWSREYAQLKDLLTAAEYKAARASVLNAHYTSPAVVGAIYGWVEQSGFRRGRVLEPALGVGNFFGLLPECMEGHRWCWP